MSEPKYTASEIVKRIELALKSLSTSIPSMNIQPEYPDIGKDFYKATIFIKVETLLKPELISETRSNRDEGYGTVQSLRPRR